LNYTGTLGVIIRAKLNGHIPSIKPILLKLQETNFRITKALEKQALIIAKE
jgi:predicted nucleic acid-binding protein